MSSTVACIGFTDPTELAVIVRDHGEPYHELSSTNKWVDASGAMLLLDRTAQYARPAYATQVRTPYRGITLLENGLAQVTLTDISGYELDPFTVVPNNRYTVGWAPVGRVALVAMGIDTEFFATAEDFFDSPRSALPGFEGEPPAEVRQFGLPWPPAMEIETFVPVENAGEALASLSGTVQFAEVHTNSVTGHDFLVSRIATVCGEIDLCAPLPVDGQPEPGAVVVGQVELLAGFPAFGLEDSSPYEQPSERVTPTFRDGEPEGGDVQTYTDEDPELPEGLVLGEDGIVRTTDEHTAWKNGDDEAGTPGGVPASETPEVDENDDAVENVADQPAQAEDDLSGIHPVGSDPDAAAGAREARPAESKGADAHDPTADTEATATREDKTEENMIVESGEDTGKSREDAGTKPSDTTPSEASEGAKPAEGAATAEGSAAASDGTPAEAPVSEGAQADIPASDGAAPDTEPAPEAATPADSSDRDSAVKGSAASNSAAGANPAADAAPSDTAPTDSASAAEASTAGSPTDEAPLPGETRREWRARTGR